jgi:hypothetical protein
MHGIETNQVLSKKWRQINELCDLVRIGNWLELARIGENWRELAGNWPNWQETGSTWRQLARTG